MKIAVISDLHLGNGDGADCFGHDDTQFLSFLNFLEGSFERIILLGDIFETLTSRRPRGQVEALLEAEDRHREIVARFQRPQYRYIHGNHDLVAANVRDAPTELRIDADGQRIVFMHGHGYDWLTRNARFL